MLGQHVRSVIKESLYKWDHVLSVLGVRRCGSLTNLKLKGNLMDECQGCECSTKCYLDLLDYLWAHCATITNVELRKMLYGGPLETKLREWKVSETGRVLRWFHDHSGWNQYYQHNPEGVAEAYVTAQEKQNP